MCSLSRAYRIRGASLVLIFQWTLLLVGVGDIVRWVDSSSSSSSSSSTHPSPSPSSRSSLPLLVSGSSLARRMPWEEEEEEERRNSGAEGENNRFTRKEEKGRGNSQSDTLLRDVLSAVVNKNRCRGGSGIFTTEPRIYESTSVNHLFRIKNGAAAAVDVLANYNNNMNLTSRFEHQQQWHSSTATIPTGCTYSDLSAELTTMQEGVDTLLKEDATYQARFLGFDPVNVALEDTKQGPRRESADNPKQRKAKRQPVGVSRSGGSVDNKGGRSTMGDAATVSLEEVGDFEHGPGVVEAMVNNKVRVWPGPLDSEHNEDDRFRVKETLHKDLKRGLTKDRETGQLQGYLDRFPLTGRSGGQQRHSLLCATYTYPQKHKNVLTEKHVWGKKCDRHMMFTSPRTMTHDRKKNELGPWHQPKNFEKRDVIELEFVGGEGYENMWQKTRHIFKYLAENEILQEHDYVFVGGDDIFLFPENLHKLFHESPLVEMHEAGVPLHFGYRHRPHWSENTFIAGAGYVVNRAAALMFAEGFMDSCDEKKITFAEDVEISQCFQNVGIAGRDTRDHRGEDRFNLFPPPYHAALANNMDHTSWFREFRSRQYPKGLDMVSEYPVIFHFMQPKDQIKYAKIFYGVEEEPPAFP